MIDIGAGHVTELQSQAAVLASRQLGTIIVAKVVCIAAHAPAAGRTTTAVYLARAMAWSGRSTLLVDWDPRGDAARTLAVSIPQLHPWATRQPLGSHFQPTGVEGLSMLAGAFDRTTIAAVDAWNSTRRRAAGDELTEQVAPFEFVVIDCPAASASFTEVALWAASEVLLPLRCGQGCLDLVPPTIESIRQIWRTPGKELAFSGVLLTQYDTADPSSPGWEQDVREFFGDVVFETVIPREVGWPATLGVPGLEAESHAARAYIELCMEVLGK